MARSLDPAGATQREVAEAWTEAVESMGLPLARAEAGEGRPRISFGAPLPARIAAEAELIDIVLTERWAAWRVRQAIRDGMPPGWRLVDVYDVWLAGPPLAGQVRAAVYRIVLAEPVDAIALEHAAAEMLAAASIPCERRKGPGVVQYDLRPLLVDLRVDAGPPTVVVATTRFHPELGTGRPEAVIGVLGDGLGGSLEAASIVRERLVLDQDRD